MDRLIKFRGKEFPNNKWIFASAYDQENEIFIIDFANFAVIDETVGQFTGFKDIDGKEIFEADIIQNQEQPDWICKVELVLGCWSAVDCGGKVNNLFCLLSDGPFKVIGNVHDNPELLQDG